MNIADKGFMVLTAAVAVLATYGCTMDGGELAEKDRNKVVTCTDTRDGEAFKFNTNSIANVRAGIGAPSSFDIVTLDGKAMTLNSNMEAWLKCEKSRN